MLPQFSNFPGPPLEAGIGGGQEGDEKMGGEEAGGPAVPAEHATFGVGGLQSVSTTMSAAPLPRSLCSASYVLAPVTQHVLWSEETHRSKHLCVPDARSPYNLPCSLDHSVRQTHGDHSQIRCTTVYRYAINTQRASAYWCPHSTASTCISRNLCKTCGGTLQQDTAMTPGPRLTPYAPTTRKQ